MQSVHPFFDILILNSWFLLLLLFEESINFRMLFNDEDKVLLRSMLTENVFVKCIQWNQKLYYYMFGKWREDRWKWETLKYIWKWLQCGYNILWCKENPMIPCSKYFTFKIKMIWYLMCICEWFLLLPFFVVVHSQRVFSYYNIYYNK